MGAFSCHAISSALARMLGGVEGNGEGKGKVSASDGDGDIGDDEGYDGIGREDDRSLAQMLQGPDSRFRWDSLFAPKMCQLIGLDHILFWIT